jgi:hypothetical protein
MRYVRMDFSAKHGCRPTQFRIDASYIVRHFRTPHTRGVQKILQLGYFKRFQERQISSQAKIEGCTAGTTSFLAQCFEF